MTGLDEFMLRLGHLNVLVSLLGGGVGSRSSVVRSYSRALTNPVPVPESAIRDVGTYLVVKKLARVRKADGTVDGAHGRSRYANLEVVLDRNAEIANIAGPDGARPEIWFQDWALTHPGARSRVGAVTVDVERIGNKSGISHLLDWSRLLGVTNARLGLTAEGRAIAFILDRGSGENPYILGAEKLVYSWLLLVGDADVSLRLLRLMDNTEGLRKADAIELMLRVCEEVQNAANIARTSSRATRVARELMADLGQERRTPAPRSTVWHRVSSRLESMVDVGVLSKIDVDGSDRRYEYFYQTTRGAKELVHVMDEIPYQDAIQILARNLGKVLADSAARKDDGACAAACHDAAVALCGPTGLHIDSYALAAAARAAQLNAVLEIDAARQAMLELAVQAPEIVRLSRGAHGDRPEFASISVRALESAGTEAFRHAFEATRTA